MLICIHLNNKINKIRKLQHIFKCDIDDVLFDIQYLVHNMNHNIVFPNNVQEEIIQRKVNINFLCKSII